MNLKKPISICPRCKNQVEWDAIHSGGVVLHQCCNCFHIVEKSQLVTLEAEYAALAKN